MEILGLSGPSGRLEVSTTAAMITRAELHVGGRTVRPLAEAPWRNETLPPSTPGHLRVLGGDFVAIPFGSAAGAAGTPAEWVDAVPAHAPEPQHGWTAEADWRVLSRDAGSIRLVLDDPGFGLERVVRTIALSADAPRIECSVELLARRDLELPFAAHPILELPESGRLRLEVEFEEGVVHPVPQDATVALPGARFTELSAVPGVDGTVIGFDEAPPRALRGRVIDQVVQLLDVRSAVRARRPDGIVIVIDWDRTALPSLQLWLSDRGIAEPPWNGRYRGLGIEPMVGAFDLGAAAALDNPIRRRGHPTTLALRAGVPRTLDWSIDAVDEHLGIT